MRALLALETGHTFYGSSIGIKGIKVGEVVFNTALTGYQEVLTDPSYTNQIISFTYPHIGNTGINLEDNQAQHVHASGVIVKSLSKYVSSWRANISLAEFLQQQNVVGIEKIDTRTLTKLLSAHGSLSGCIMSGIIDENYAIQQAKAYANLAAENLAIKVTTKEKYDIGVNKLKIVVVDLGVKKGILSSLSKLGCSMIIVPASTPVKDIIDENPDGILLSNGPGDPLKCTEIIENVKELCSKRIPIFGICLGHQLLALALGALTYKLGFGHHGNNHPVLDLLNNKVMITSQNHCYAVDARSLPAELVMTHYSLFDKSLQGFRHKTLPIFGFQGHPEASPGPHDAMEIFNDFLGAVRKTHAKTLEYT